MISIRRENERNKPEGCSKWYFIFNAIIESHNLKEITLCGRSYTWSNNQEDPLFEKLDRILVSPAWESHYPMVNVIALERALSDHAPLLIDSGEHFISHYLFRFEISD